MKRRPSSASNIYRILAGAVGSMIVVGALVALWTLLMGRTTLPAQGVATRKPGAQPVTVGGPVSRQGPPVSPEYVTVREQNFGIWSYGATRSDIEPLHASINYKHDTVDDILAYASENRALLPEVVRAGGRAEVAISFVYPVGGEWYRNFARQHGFHANTTQLQVGAPGSSGSATMSIGGTTEDPLPQDKIDNMAMGFFRNSVDGVFGAYGTVDAARISIVAAEPRVFMVDVTPAWVRMDLAQAGVPDQLQQPPSVALPYGWMERLGLQNFTSLPLPTRIPPPVGTYVPPLP